MRRVFEWDDAKAASNFVKHRIEFGFAAKVFDDPACLDIDASRPEDMEARRKIVGLVAGRLITLVYTVRTGAIRVISARRSNDGERKVYDYGSLRPRS